ncbi:hypothetical protein LMG3410_00305 [Achromobacter aegrifaciens]|uniref:DUF695 domain-containing protein n=1 Tax=Achromobacter aegrifaciens TaxID=1287736 RepID=UPI0014695322|nr:DUF695 domain-containing protein [Achromobacter aegrifaciens]CAB3821792.1 hypothetical protein LMG3410_00305 [Achromobacter aegrifaciens]
MSSIFPGDLWAVGEAQVEGLTVIVRFRTGLPSATDREINENLVIISWPYQGIESGMPNDEDKQSHNSFEEAIEKGFENSDIGVQVACLTGNHHKEWRYYTRDVEAFLDAFNACLPGHPVYPIQLRMYKDPDWNALSGLQPQGSDQLH